MKTSKTKVTASATPTVSGTPPKKTKREDPQPFRLQWWHYGLMLLGVVLIAFEIYGPALDGPFVLDDIYLPFMNPALANRPLQAWINVRPLLMLSFYANFKMHGTEPYYYHWLNVLIHALNSILAYLIVRKMLDWVGEKGTRREILAAFAGAVFLTHPVQTESVSYVASRSEVLSIFFFLAAYAVFLYRRTEAINWTWSVAVLVLFGIAASTKEHAVTLPLLLLLTDYWFNPGFRLDGVKRNWRLYGLVLAGGAFGVFAVLTVLRYSPSAGFNLRDLHWYEYLFTQFRSICVYLRLFVLPVGQNLDYDVPISRTLFDQGAILFLILLVALAAAAWIYRRKFPLASFGFFGFLLLLAPTSSVVPIRDVLVAHRLHLPFICL